MKLKKTYLHFLLIAMLTLFVGCGNKNKNENKNLNHQLTEMAAKLNEAVPAQLDESTIFMGAEVSPDNIFTYNYYIVGTDDAIGLMDEMEAQTRANIKEAFQINEDLKIFTDNDVTIEYVYRDEDENMIRTIRITPEDYK